MLTTMSMPPSLAAVSATTDLIASAIGDIEPPRGRLLALVAHLLRDRFGAFAVDVGDGDERAFGREDARGGAAHATCATGQRTLNPATERLNSL